MKQTALTLGLIGLIFFIIWGGTKIYSNITFDRNCGGHLKRAADANTVELATQEMELAVSYLEKKEMTSGYTSILFNTPDEDIGFWYSNLKSSLGELRLVKPDADQLVKSNVLMKLRETLMDGGRITRPNGIEIFPYNILFLLWGIGSAIVAVVGLGIFLVMHNHL